MVNPKAETIDIKADSNNEFFLIHGYSGSPTDFKNLPEYLHQRFNANVKVIRLIGHGTQVEDLDNVTYEDLSKQVEIELKKDLAKGRKIIIGGVSFGAILALRFASEYPVVGVINVCPPYLFKFPFNIPGLGILGKFKKYWKKTRGQNEKEERDDSFSYACMHANGLGIVKKANNDLKERMKNIKCPVLSIHSYTDPIGHYRSLMEIDKNVKSSIKKERILDTKVHNVFFSMNSKETYREIINFVKDYGLFEKKKKEKVAAIVPAYNEAKRIGNVLEVLERVKSLDEIIVVDDGSMDNTEDTVKKFKKVKYLKNKVNLGKAASMDLGVKSTNADIIFFCDADLIGIKEDIVKGIIGPVIEGKYDMFIGLRGNLMQKAVHLFAINSGERAIRREVWEKLPKYFKYKYRVEAGLNYYVTQYFGGFGYKEFDYSQPTKEKKYGFIKGTMLRWGMNLDVMYVYTRDVIERAIRFIF